MKKGNRTVILGFCLVFLGLLAGCNNPNKPSANTDKSSASTKVTTELTVSSKESRETKETTALTTELSSTVQDTKETEESHEQPKEEQVPEAMDLSQILQGDYSSLNGTWENGLGNIIFVENNTMNFTDISNQKQPAEIVGGNVDIPILNSPDGTPELIAYMGDNNKVKSYEQELGIEENQGFISLRSNLPGAVIYVSFLPKGIMGDILEGDADKDKIVAVGTQNTATSVRAEYVYYKID